MDVDGVGQRSRLEGRHSLHISRAETRTAVSSATVGTTIEWYDFFLYATAAGLVFDKLYFPQGDSGLALVLSYSATGSVARRPSWRPCTSWASRPA